MQIRDYHREQADAGGRLPLRRRLGPRDDGAAAQELPRPRDAPQAGERKTRVIYMSPAGKALQPGGGASASGATTTTSCSSAATTRAWTSASSKSAWTRRSPSGDFVLTGGEIAAMAVADCVCRMVPGVLADEECYTGESHLGRPARVPAVHPPRGLGGPRRAARTPAPATTRSARAGGGKSSSSARMDKRPDMFEKLELTIEGGQKARGRDTGMSAFRTS